MTFRSPLRNEWDRYKPQMVAQQNAPGYDGAVARAMLDFMPVLVDAFERERDKGTNPKHMLEALTGVIVNIAEQAIKGAVKGNSQKDALRIMLERLHAEIRRRLDEPGMNGSILLPGLGG